MATREGPVQDGASPLSRDARSGSFSSPKISSGTRHATRHTMPIEIASNSLKTNNRCHAYSTHFFRPKNARIAPRTAVSSFFDAPQIVDPLHVRKEPS